MGLFDVFKKKPVDSKVAQPMSEEEKAECLIEATFNEVSEKCENGENMSVLNDYERVFFVVQSLENTVVDGGFKCYYFEYGEFANEAPNAFERIGAVQNAEVCRKALSVFGGSLPADMQAREEVLDNTDCDDWLDDCDGEYYDCEEDLTAFVYTFLTENREYFN